MIFSSAIENVTKIKKRNQKFWTSSKNMTIARGSFLMKFDKKNNFGRRQKQRQKHDHKNWKNKCQTKTSCPWNTTYMWHRLRHVVAFWIEPVSQFSVVVSVFVFVFVGGVCLFRRFARQNVRHFFRKGCCFFAKSMIFRRKFQGNLPEFREILNHFQNSMNFISEHVCFKFSSRHL